MSSSRVAATASLGMKVSLGHKKGFGTYDNASPHHSITIERSFEADLTDEQLVAKADECHQLARKLVEKKINDDLKELQDAG